MVDNDVLLADIAANDSHHDFHHNIKEIIKYYQRGVKGTLEKGKIDADEARTLGYVIDTLNKDDTSTSSVKNTRLSLHSDDVIKEPTKIFNMKTVSDVEYQVFKFRYKKGDDLSFKDLKKIMSDTSDNDTSVFSDFNINGTIFVHDAAAINIYNILFKKSPDENLELYIAHCPEISNDPAPKATLETVSNYGSDSVKYYSVVPSNKGDTVYNYILDRSGVYNTEGRNVFNSTYQVKFTEFNIDKKNNMTTDVTYSELNVKGTKIFEHDYKVKSRSSNNDSTISSVTSKINKLRNKSRTGKTLKDKEVFDLNTSYQMKRGGDQLQVCFAKKIHDRIFENKGLIDFKTIGEQNEMSDLIKNKKITDVYFVTHDQIAAAYALLLGISVIFTNSKPGVKTVMIYKSSKTINKELIERNKYDKAMIFFGNEDNFKEKLKDNTKTVELSKQYNDMFKTIKENAMNDYLSSNTTQKMRDVVTYFKTNGVSITLPENIKYEDISIIKSTIKRIIENKINYDKFLLEIIENGVVNGKGKIKDCVDLIIKNPKRGRETFKKMMKFIHIFTHLINNYTINIDLMSFIEKTRSTILDNNINEIVDVINSVLYYDRYINDIRTKNIPLLAYIYNKKLGGKTKEKKTTIAGFDDIFKDANNEMTTILNTRKKFNENDVKTYTMTYFNIVDSKNIASAVLTPNEPSNYFYELKTYISEILKLSNTLKEELGKNNDDTAQRIMKTTELFLSNFINNDINPYFTTTGQSGGKIMKNLMSGGAIDALKENVFESNIIILEYFLNEYNGTASEDNDFYTNFYRKNTNASLSNINIDMHIKRLKYNFRELLKQEYENTISNKELLTITLMNIFIANILSDTHENNININLRGIYELASGSFNYEYMTTRILKENVYYIESEYYDDVEMLDGELFNKTFFEYVYKFKRDAGFVNLEDANEFIFSYHEHEMDELISNMSETITLYNTSGLITLIKDVYMRIREKYSSNFIYFIENHNIIFTILEAFNDLLVNCQSYSEEFNTLSKIKEEKILIYLNFLSDVKLISYGLYLVEYLSIFYHELEYLYEDADENIMNIIKEVKNVIDELNKDIVNKAYISKGYTGEIESGRLVKERDILKSNLEVLFNIYENNTYKNIDKLYLNKVLLDFLKTKQSYMFNLLNDVRIKVLLFSFLYDVNSYSQLLEISAERQNNLIRDISILNFSNLFDTFKKLEDDENKFMVQYITYNFIDNFINAVNNLYIQNVYLNHDMDTLEKLKMYVDTNLISFLETYGIDNIVLYRRFDSNFFDIHKNAYCGTKKILQTTEPEKIPLIDTIEIVLPEGDKANIEDDSKAIALQLYTIFNNYYSKNKLLYNFDSCRFEEKQIYDRRNDDDTNVKSPLLVAGGYKKKNKNNKIKRITRKLRNHNRKMTHKIKNKYSKKYTNKTR
jgi:hypothetical protein